MPFIKIAIKSAISSYFKDWSDVPFYLLQQRFPTTSSHIGGMMVSVLASSAIYRRSDQLSVQIKDCQTGICFLSFACSLPILILPYTECTHH